MIDEKKIINDIKQWSKEREIKWTTESVISLLESAPKIGGWIPCSERLPEENEEVICCFKSGVVKALVLFNCKFHGKVYAYEKSDIIAWQPLPEEYHG